MSKPIDHGDENQVDPLKKRQRLKHEEDAEFLRRVLQTYEGRAVIWKIMDDCKMFSPVSIADNPLILAGCQAIQNVGKRVREDVLTVDVNSFNIMQSEAIARAERAKHGG